MEFCAIASGSSGNCIYVGHEGTRVLVDAGISGKRICEGLESLGLLPGDISAILLTHEHSDHIQGAAVIANRYGIPVYGTRSTVDSVSHNASKGLSAGLMHFVKPDVGFKIGEIEVMPFRISHDASDPVSYTFRAGGRKLSMATDLGVFDDYIVERLSGADALYIEANHDLNMLMVGPYPYHLKQRIHSELGHLSNDDTCELILRLQDEKLKNVVLAHLSKENNFPELAQRTVEAALKMKWKAGKAPQVCVAKRSEVSSLIRL